MGVYTASAGAERALETFAGDRPSGPHVEHEPESSATFREAFAICMARIDEVRDVRDHLRRRGRSIAAWSALHAAREHVQGPHRLHQSEDLDRLARILEGIDAELRAETRRAGFFDEPQAPASHTRMRCDRPGKMGRGTPQ